MLDFMKSAIRGACVAFLPSLRCRTDGVLAKLGEPVEYSSTGELGHPANMHLSNCVWAEKSKAEQSIRLSARRLFLQGQRVCNALTWTAIQQTTPLQILRGFQLKKTSRTALRTAPRTVAIPRTSPFSRLMQSVLFAPVAPLATNLKTLPQTMACTFPPSAMLYRARTGLTLSARRMSVLTFVPGKGYFNGLSV